MYSKKVRKKTKSKKYSAIGICTKSVIQGKGFKRGNFNCKKREVLNYIKVVNVVEERVKKRKRIFSWFSSNNNNKKYQKLPTDNDEISQKTLFEQYKKLIEAAKKIDIPTQEFEKWTIQESPYTNNGKVNLKLMEEHVIEAEQALECMSKNKKGGGKREKSSTFNIGSRISGEFPIEDEKGNRIGKKPFYGVITNKLKIIKQK